MPIKLFSIVLLSLGLLATALPTQAAEEAALVVMAKGSVNAIASDGSSRALNRRDKVLVGDTLKTGADAMLQVRFIDKGLLTLRENSEFKIDSYSPHTDAGGHVLMHLVTGGFRTITGSIGHGSKDSYEVTTSAASIGIRGTHYEVVQESPKSVVMAVWAGGITVRNNNGSLNLGRDAGFSYSRVTLGEPPKGLLKAPEVFQQPPAATSDKPKEEKSAEAKTASNEKKPANEQQAQGEAKPKGAQQPDTAPTTAEAAPANGSAQPNTSTTAPAAVEGDFALTSSVTAPPPPPPTAPAPITNVSSPTPTAPQQTVDFTQTNTTLNNTITSPDPWLTPAKSDPRLLIAEYDQLKTNPNQFGVVVDAIKDPNILATIISPQAPTPLDFTSVGPFSFDISYFYDNGTGTPPPPTPVTITLSGNDNSLAALIADIQAELTAAGAPVGVRESTQNPGKLEFYTNNNNAQLAFGLYNFNFANTTASATQIVGALGGLDSNIMAHGSFDPPEVMQGYIVYGKDGRPVFIGPGDKTAPGTLPNLGDPTSIEIGRVSNVPLQGYVAAVGGNPNVSWGYWNASATNPIQLYPDVNNPTFVKQETKPVYWLSAKAADPTTLTGTQIYAASATGGTFLASAQDGPVLGVGGSFQVNFATGAVQNGVFTVATQNQTWDTQFAGQYQNARAQMKVTSGNLIGNINCTNCVDGALGGVFVAPGDAFAGGFDMEAKGDPKVHTEGLFLMKKQ